MHIELRFYPLLPLYKLGIFKPTYPCRYLVKVRELFMPICLFISKKIIFLEIKSHSQLSISEVLFGFKQCDRLGPCSGIPVTETVK